MCVSHHHHQIITSALFSECSYPTSPKLLDGFELVFVHHDAPAAKPNPRSLAPGGHILEQLLLRVGEFLRHQSNSSICSQSHAPIIDRRSPGFSASNATLSGPTT